MSFAELLTAPGVAVALEITPPKSRRPQVLLRRASLLGSAAAAINVIQRPDRQSSLEASCDLAEHGYLPVWHLVARGKDAHDLPAALERAAQAGIGEVLCILGDGPGEPAMKVRDMVRAVRDGLPAGSVGATVNQYTNDHRKALQNLFGKLDAGATFVETQPVFSLADLEPVVTETRARFPATSFVAMAMPVEDEAAAARMEARLQLQIPREYRTRIESGSDGAWAAFADVLRELRDSDLVDCVAIMTPEMDPPAATRERLLIALRDSGLVAAASRA